MRSALRLCATALAVAAAADERADATRFQAWIRQRQYPDDCRPAVGAVAQQQYFHVLGLGAQMVSLKFNLVSALLQGQVYHFPTSHYVNPLRCASRSFDCYFEPPTNCTAPARKGAGRTVAAAAAAATVPARALHARVQDARIHWCFDLPRRKLSRLAGLAGVHGMAWYHAQLAAFLFRPNAELVGVGRAMLGSMEVANRTGGKGGRARPSGGPAANSSCVAMHIRRTDKHTEDHRTASRSFADFGAVFKAWAYWVYPGQASGLSVFLGSEDVKTFAAMPPLLAPFAAYWISGSYFVMDMSAGKRFVNIKQGNDRLGELYGGLSGLAAKGGGTLSPAERAALSKDEGMALVAQIVLMSGCEAFVGSYSSNVAILVHDLMLARRIARGEALHALDVNGRVYCGCGAGFCMQAERKATRDPTLSVRQIVANFKDPGR